MNILQELNKEQQAAVTHENGPLLIVAGAGTGKTKSIVSRIAWLVENKKAEINEILALTYTDKAANEMIERIDLLMPYGYGEHWISTFHSFCDKILKKHIVELGLGTNYKLFTETDCWILLRQNIDKLNLDYFRSNSNPTRFFQDLLKYFSRCQDEGIFPEKYLHYAENLTLDSDNIEFVSGINWQNIDNEQKKEIRSVEIKKQKELAGAYYAYKNILRENGALDFADLVSLTYKLFQKSPFLLTKYRQQFKYILVDEFQDTNFLQYQLIKLLSEPQNNLTVVGDDDQSIYKFRGASISNIMQFMDDFPQAKSVVLTENYRSGQNILDFAYKFIAQNNPNRLEIKLGLNKKLLSRCEEKGEVNCLNFADGYDEANNVIKKIIELREMENPSWSDFAILFRAKSSADFFIQALNFAGVPYQFLAESGLYNQRAIMDLLCYFDLLGNYHDSVAMYQILSWSIFNIEQEQIIKICQIAKQKSLSLYEAGQQAAAINGINQETSKQLNILFSYLQKHAVLAKKEKPFAIFLRILHETGYLAYLNKNIDREKKQALHYLEQFGQKIKNFEQNNKTAYINDFVKIIKMEMEAGESGPISFDPEIGPDMVKIMTVHSAKGLEFQNVFIVNMVDRKFPSDNRTEAIDMPEVFIKEKSDSKNAHIEEERRLFYVAATRAKKRLFLTWAKNYNSEREKKPSKFLLEAGFSSFEQAEVKSDKFFFDFQTEKSSKDNYDLPEKFSISDIILYEKCPQRYKFAKILKIPTFGHGSLSFGTTIHETLKQFVFEYESDKAEQTDIFGGMKQENKPDLKRLREIYENNWLDDWYRNKEEKQQYHENGLKLLKNFYEDFLRQKPKIKFLEYPFRWKIGSYQFTGRIDRIDEVNDSFVIIDYKTGQTKTELNAEDKRQLLFYQIVAEESLKFKLEKLVYYYLESGEKTEFIGQTKDKEKLKERLLDVIAQIKNNCFEPKASEFNCQYCDYANICEHKKL